MTFIGSSEAIAKNFEYLMYGLNLNADQMNGLDSYTTENDERMLELLAESKKRSGGHWFDGKFGLNEISLVNIYINYFKHYHQSSCNGTYPSPSSSSS